METRKNKGEEEGDDEGSREEGRGEEEERIRRGGWKGGSKNFLSLYPYSSHILMYTPSHLTLLHSSHILM